MHELAGVGVRSLTFIMQPGATATLCVTVHLRQATVTVKDLSADALVVNATRYG